MSANFFWIVLWICETYYLEEGFIWLLFIKEKCLHIASTFGKSICFHIYVSSACKEGRDQKDDCVLPEFPSMTPFSPFMAKNITAFL